MSRVVVATRLVVLFVGVIGPASSAFGQASFQVVGSLDPDEPTYYVRGVSGDGQVVVGWVTSADGSEAFRWTASDGILLLGDFPGGQFRGAALGASGDGSVIVGYGTRSEAAWETTAFKWTSHTGMQELWRPGWSRAYGASPSSSIANGTQPAARLPKRPRPSSQTAASCNSHPCGPPADKLVLTQPCPTRTISIGLVSKASFGLLKSKRGGYGHRTEREQPAPSRQPIPFAIVACLQEEQ